MLGHVQPRALIVDDEAPAREELRYLLQEIGPVVDDLPVQVVGEATNGEEALVLLGSPGHPDARPQRPRGGP